MMKKKVVPFLLATLFGAPATHAAVDLIAIGTISGSYEDLSGQTAGLLENGIPGNRLGGMGSGLAYAGCNRFLALPDRGPNAKAYDAAVDDTVSYINRFHTVHMSLSPSDAGAALPFTLTPFVTRTTLLSSSAPLVYGTGAGLGVAALNAHGTRSEDIPAKLEGLAFGPDIAIGGEVRHTLFLSTDNDYVATVKDGNHPAGFDNPNTFFVFAVDDADVPDFQHQRLEANEHCGRPHDHGDGDDRRGHGR